MESAAFNHLPQRGERAESEGEQRRTQHTHTPLSNLMNVDDKVYKFFLFQSNLSNDSISARNCVAQQDCIIKIVLYYLSSSCRSAGCYSSLWLHICFSQCSNSAWTFTSPVWEHFLSPAPCGFDQGIYEQYYHGLATRSRNSILYFS